jgi:hypothetical protein
MRGRHRVWLAVGCALWIAGCARPQPSPILAGWTPPPAAPVTPAVQPNQTSVPAPTPVCTNEAAFVEDLTIPDGTVVSPGERLDKRWSVRNTGTCNWNAAYRLVPLGEREFSVPDEVALFPARAGELATLQVMLGAPGTPGEYASRWQALAPDGSLFGDPIFVFVIVEPATPTPEPTAIPGSQ